MFTTIPDIRVNHVLTTSEQLFLFLFWWSGGLSKDDAVEASGKSLSTVTRYVVKLVNEGYLAPISQPLPVGKRGRPFSIYVPIRSIIMEEFPGWPLPETEEDVAGFSEMAGPALLTSKLNDSLFYIEWVDGNKYPLRWVAERLMNRGEFIGEMVNAVGGLLLHMEMNDRRLFVDEQPGATAYPDDRAEIYAYLLTAIKMFRKILSAMEQIAILDTWRGLDSVGGTEYEGHLKVLQKVAAGAISPNGSAVSTMKARLVSQGLAPDSVEIGSHVDAALRHFGFALGYDSYDEDAAIAANKVFVDVLKVALNDPTYQETLAEVRNAQTPILDQMAAQVTLKAEQEAEALDIEGL